MGRFWGYFNPDSVDKDGMSNCVTTGLDKVVDKKEKLIAQTFHSASVMAGKLGGVQTKILMYPSAHYIHCYAHQLNIIVSKASQGNKY